MNNPTPEMIKEARKSCGLNQRQAADVIHKSIRTWQKWESGFQKMDSAYYELFIIKVYLAKQNIVIDEIKKILPKSPIEAPLRSDPDFSIKMERLLNGIIT